LPAVSSGRVLFCLFFAHPAFVQAGTGTRRKQSFAAQMDGTHRRSPTSGFRFTPCLGGRQSTRPQHRTATVGRKGAIGPRQGHPRIPPGEGVKGSCDRASFFSRAERGFTGEGGGRGGGEIKPAELSWSSVYDDQRAAGAGKKGAFRRRLSAGSAGGPRQTTSPPSALNKSIGTPRRGKARRRKTRLRSARPFVGHAKHEWPRGPGEWVSRSSSRWHRPRKRLLAQPGGPESAFGGPVRFTAGGRRSCAQGPPHSNEDGERSFIRTSCPTTSAWARRRGLGREGGGGPVKAPCSVSL